MDFSMTSPDCTPLPDFNAHIRIKPRLLVGKHSNSSGGDTDRSTPVNIAANSVCIFMYIICSFLENVNICGLQTALQFR